MTTKNSLLFIISPSLSTEEAAELFPDGWDEIRPYLRVTNTPEKLNEERNPPEPSLTVD
jgi:hypothetical protein